MASALDAALAAGVAARQGQRCDVDAVELQVLHDQLALLHDLLQTMAVALVLGVSGDELLHAVNTARDWAAEMAARSACIAGGAAGRPIH